MYCDNSNNLGFESQPINFVPFDDYGPEPPNVPPLEFQDAPDDPFPGTASLFGFPDADSSPVEANKPEHVEHVQAQLQTTRRYTKDKAAQQYIPRGCIADKIVSQFERYTDIIHILPFITTVMYVSSILLKHNVTLTIDGNTIHPSIWITVLATSGSSKTYTLDTIGQSIDCSSVDWTADDLIWDANGAGSRAELIEEWTVNNNRMMCVDEVTFFFQQIRKDDGPFAKAFQDFLLAYSHHPIRNNTKTAGKSAVEKPIVSFFGLGTPKTFIDAVTERDIESGFFFRWLHVIDNTTRTSVRKYIYPGDILDCVKDDWTDIIQSIKHQQYIVTTQTRQKLAKDFDTYMAEIESWPEDEQIPKSYTRREAYAHHRLAVIYHIMLGHGKEKEIAYSTYKEAGKFLRLCRDAAIYIIQQRKNPESLILLKKIDGLIHKRSEKGKETNWRNIVEAKICDTRTARMYIDLIQKDESRGKHK